MSAVQEKRSYARLTIWFPVTVRTADGREIGGICRDVSPAGMLVSTMSLLELGRATVVFRVEQTERDHVVDGDVIRVVYDADDVTHAFPHRCAIEFKEPLGGFLDELKQFAKT